MKKLGLKYYKRQKAHKYAEQLRQIPRKCKEIRRQLTTALLSMMKNTFLSPTMICQEILIFMHLIKNILQLKQNTNQKKNTKKKVLVWLSVSAKGVSRSFICITKGPAMTADLYIKVNFLHLLKLTKIHDNYVFWSDLSTSHYAKKTLQWLLGHHINFIPKQANPPKVPKARPVEDLWSMLADKVYEGG